MTTHSDIIQRRQAVKELVEAGWTLDRIAARLGISRKTVSRDKAELGLAQPASKPLSESEYQLASDMLNDGCNLAEIARTLGRNRSCISKHFKGQGWTLSQSGSYSRMLKQYGEVFDERNQS